VIFEVCERGILFPNSGLDLTRSLTENLIPFCTYRSGYISYQCFSLHHSFQTGSGTHPAS